MTKGLATAIGCLAIILWSIDTSINVFLSRLPVFQMLAMAWFICFLGYAFILTVKGKWSTLKQPWPVWVMGTLGVSGAHCAMIWSLRLCPPTQASVLSALWPIYVIVLSAKLLHENSKKWHLAGAIIGFIGVGIVLTHGQGLTGYHWQYSKGYALAILSGLLWTGYVLMSRKIPAMPSEMMGLFIGIGAPIALMLHFQTEDFVAPNYFEWPLLIIKGLMTLGVAYYCWDYGIKRGQFILLNVLSYFNPLLAIGWLILFGLSASEKSLWLGSVLVTISCLLCSNVFAKWMRKHKE